jgi:hypothetical protein
MIMRINRRSITQKDKTGPLVGKTKKSRGLTVKIRTKLKDLWRWKGSFVIFKIAGAYVQDSS